MILVRQRLARSVLALAEYIWDVVISDQDPGGCLTRGHDVRGSSERPDKGYDLLIAALVAVADMPWVISRRSWTYSRHVRLDLMSY